MSEPVLLPIHAERAAQLLRRGLDPDDDSWSLKDAADMVAGFLEGRSVWYLNTEVE